MPSLVSLNYCDVTTVELQFGLRFSDNERYILNCFSKSEIEVVARYELLKMRTTLTEKLHRAQRQFEMAEVDTEKHFFSLSRSWYYWKKTGWCGRTAGNKKLT